MSLGIVVVCAQTISAGAFVDLPRETFTAPTDTRRRGDEALRALRRRWRPSIEAGVAVLADAGTTDAAGVIAWPPALTFALGVDLRRGLSDLLELHGRLELFGPQTMTVVPAGQSARVAPMACAGSRSFAPLTGWGLHAGLSVGLRARVFALRSPFFVGLAMRVGLWAGGASGEATATCLTTLGETRLLDREQGSVGASLLDLGGALETGFRFGAREEGTLSLRLIAGGIGAGDPAVRGAVFTFGWSLR